MIGKLLCLEGGKASFMKTHKKSISVLPRKGLGQNPKKIIVTYKNEEGVESIDLFNLLSANPTKWSNTIKQFVGFCRRFV